MTSPDTTATAARPHATTPGGPGRDEPVAVRLLRRIEDEPRLDGLADRLTGLGRALTATPGLRDLLLGRPAGHAMHPWLTDVPIGAWTSASVLDLAGGRAARPAARRLVGLGVLAAVPTALTGLAELGHADERARRVGALHAAGNGAALALYAASWLVRRREQHLAGAVLALAGAGAASASGYLGGHLAIARKVGSRAAAFADSLPAGAGSPTSGAHAPDGTGPLT